MKRKEAEDVIGGKDAWENVDRADGEFFLAVLLRVCVCVCVCWVRGSGGKPKLVSGGRSLSLPRSPLKASSLEIASFPTELRTSYLPDTSPSTVDHHLYIHKTPY